MPANVEPPIEDGQFDDAPEDQLVVPATATTDPRDGHRFIDDDPLLEWSSESEEEQDEFEVEEDNMEYEAYQTLRAEDEDWEQTERDFTKQYNRLKQHVAVRTGAAQGVLQSNAPSRSAVASLPALNRPRPPKPSASDSSKKEHAKDKAENQLQALSKYSSRLRNLDLPYELGVGVNRKGPSATANQKDKSDRATNEQVLDPRTRIILFKMIGRGLLFEVNGCVSTGKEANVYHALTPERQHLALKIYKTSILVFKDRDRYVSGEYRFRRGYSRHNPRKMVRVWAEKEMRNLKRLKAAGLRCPDAVEVRENVLVMGFIGDSDGWASPRLKDATIPASAVSNLYVELIIIVRKMFHDCKLVHADLSEYNILYHIESPTSSTSNPELPTATQSEISEDAKVPEEPRGHLYIIDVSQSVEQDHPHAFDFLRSDLKNVEDFFSKRGVKCLSLRRSFEFVTNPDLKGDGSAEDILRKWIEEDSNADKQSGFDDGEDDGDVKGDEDEVFMRSYIPRTLNEVFDPERDVGKLQSGEGEKLIYQDTIGIVAPKAEGEDAEKSAQTKVRFEGDRDDHGVDASDGEEEDDEDGEEDGDSEDEGDNGEYKERKPRGHRHEDKEAKKERKKVAKEEAREKRKHKIPKAEKKRKIKNTSRGAK
ncbi:RIO1-domain-containing protein [Cristinia sonorae]|uniref:Serine/threonine-protein kinase RIO1 n=1 Tax=Cristinia sonorae TaxID=1940300 RepID=A0A8K0XSX6_9AGAR|nr:RIO1-domain-containing protein [Cristinia sonorae]